MAALPSRTGPRVWCKPRAAELLVTAASLLMLGAMLLRLNTRIELSLLREAVVQPSSEYIEHLHDGHVQSAAVFQSPDQRVASSYGDRQTQTHMQFSDHTRTWVDITYEEGQKTPESSKVGRNLLLTQYSGKVELTHLHVFVRSFRQHNSQAHVVIIINDTVSQQAAAFFDEHKVELYHSAEMNKYTHVQSRFLAAREYLNLHKADYDIVFQADTDVLFLGDPFCAYPNMQHGIVAFAESSDLPIGKCRGHRRWLRTCHGPEAYSTYWNHLRLCAGTIGGNMTSMVLFLEHLIPHFPRCNDQGTFIHLFYSNYLADLGIQTFRDLFETGRVATLSGPRVQVVNYLPVNGLGQPYLLWHQYRHHPALMELANQWYPLEDGIPTTPTQSTRQPEQPQNFVSCHTYGCNSCGTANFGAPEGCARDTETTLVTSLFDVIRGGQWVVEEEYVKWATAVLRIPMPMYVYTEPKFEALVRKERAHMINMTKIVVETQPHPYLELRPQIEKIMQGKDFKATMADPDRPETSQGSYVQALFARVKYVVAASEENAFLARFFFYVDPVAGRWAQDMPPQRWPNLATLQVLAAGKIMIQQNVGARELAQHPLTNDLTTTYGNKTALSPNMIGGTEGAWVELHRQVETVLSDWLNQRRIINGLGQALSVVWRRHPEMFSVMPRIVESEERCDWLPREPTNPDWLPLFCNVS